MKIFLREYLTKLLTKKFIAKQYLTFVFICLASLASMLFTYPVKKTAINIRDNIYSSKQNALIAESAKEFSKHYSPEYSLRLAKEKQYKNKIRNLVPYVRIIDSITSWPLFVAKNTFFILLMVFFIIRPMYYGTKLSFKILKT